MRALLLGLVTAAYLLAADGTIQNGTTGKPQPGADISLLQITANGPRLVATAKSGADGSFKIEPPAGATQQPGPQLLQANFGGVTYNHMIPPGSPSSNLKIDVYAASTKPGAAKVATHFMLLEPANGQMTVSEAFVFTNDSKLTYNDPQHGTLHFYLPPGANGKVNVNVVAPNSVPIRNTAVPAGQPNVYQVNFPIKPGESRVDISYQMPFQSPGTFETKVLFPNPNTKVLAPPGVTLAAKGLNTVGVEPRSKATVYNADGGNLRIDVQGTGALARGDNGDQTAGDQNSGADQSGDQGGGAQISELLPQLYGKVNPADGFWASFNAVKWVLLLVFATLGLGFAYLYRRESPMTNERHR